MRQNRSKNKDSYEVELNLAPFLDILSVCICFLLTTAVWFSVSAIPVAPGSGTKSSASKNSCSLKVQLREASVLQLDYQGTPSLHQKVAADQLESTLKSLPVPTTESCAVLSAKTGISYGELVATADRLRKAGYTRLALGHSLRRTP